MFKEFLVLFCVVLLRCQAQTGRIRRPVDCAWTAWTEWTDLGDGREFRTRGVGRPARNGGARCIGETQEIRNKQFPTSPSKFLTNFIPGNRERLPLGGHLLRPGELPLSYTKSRDLAIVIDTTVFPVAIPLYKSTIANLLGSICGDIGSAPEDNIISLIVYDHTGASVIHAFNDTQSKAVIQNKILGVTSTSASQLSLVGEAMATAKHQISSYGTGTRFANLANKDILLFTTYRTDCSIAEIRRATELKVLGRVYVIVLGGPAGGSDLCLQQFASERVDFHYLRLADFEDIRALGSWVLEVTGAGNPCVPRTSA